MAIPPFLPPGDVDAVKEAAESLSDWQTSIIFLLSGIGGTMIFVGRSVGGWARKMTEKHDGRFAQIEERIETLENHRHATYMRIVALESLAREVDSIGRRVDAGFSGINDALEKMGDRCYAHFSSTEERNRGG